MISHNELLFALDSTDNIVVMTSLDGVITYVNKAFETTYGYRRDEVVGAKTSILKSGHHTKDFYRDLWDTITNGETWEGDFLNHTRDKREVWEHTKISPIHNQRRQLTGFIAVSDNITTKRILEQQIQEEQFLLNELVANSPVAITIAQPLMVNGQVDDIIVLKANPVAGVIFNRLGLTGMRFRVLMPSFANYFVQLDSITSEKQALEVYVPELAKHLSFRTFPLPNGRFCALFYDVTDYKRTIAALQESEERYSSLVEDTPALICRFDNQANITYVNKFSLINRKLDDIIGQSFYSFFDEASVRLIQKKLSHIKGHVTTVDFEVQMPVNNQVRWLKWVVRALFDAEGKIFDYQAVGVDFTDFKMAEQALAENRNMLNSIVNNSLIGVMVVNVRNEIVFVNSRMVEMFLYAEEEFYRMQNPHITLVDDENGIRRRFTDMLNHERDSFTAEREYVRKDGTVFWGSLYLSPVRDAGGEIREVVALVADIDLKKQFEMRLIEDEKKLKALNATKDKLFSIIAHDIKNPFNAILGFASLLHAQLDDFSKDEIRVFIEKILEAGENTYKLLEDLLTWGRSQLGKLSMKVVSNSPRAMVDEIFHYYTILAQNKSIQLVNALPDDLCVMADTDMLKFVLRNLIHNGIKFTNTHGTVECRAQSANTDGRVAIAVCDNGIGIRPEKLGVLFDISAFLSTTGTANEKGTGLGLSLSKEMVEKNGGNLSVVSEVGKGTTFLIELPVA
ncbi:MAG: PAS domain S-box protein [Marinilabiliaceae bacterium]|nr:PAS domain S-box protein [Marinilabiliaceae bacterium]